MQVTFTGTEATGMRGILALDSHSGASGIGIGIETLSGVPVGMNDEEGAIFTLVTGNNALSLNAGYNAFTAKIWFRNVLRKRHGYI